MGSADATVEKLYISYECVHKLCQKAAEHCKAQGRGIDLIIAIGGGGFIPARILRSFIKEKNGKNIPIQAIGLSLYEQMGDEPTETIGKEVIRTQWIDFGNLSQHFDSLIGKNIIIVDEVDDTRTTLHYALTELEKDIAELQKELGREDEVTTFQIFVLHNKLKPKRAELPQQMFDENRYIVGEHVEDKWIAYPWEATDIDTHTELARKQALPHSEDLLRQHLPLRSSSSRLNHPLDYLISIPEDFFSCIHNFIGFDNRVMYQGIDDNLILEYFKNTLSANQGIRNQSEAELNSVNRVPGFLQSCVKIIQSYDVPRELKLAAAVYLKHVINNYWVSNEIIDEEKQFIKQNFLEILNNSDYYIKHQLVPTLRLLIQIELENWGELLEGTYEILNLYSLSTPDSSSLNLVHTGILSLSEIVRSYRWMKNEDRQELDGIIKAQFPAMLKIGWALANSELDESKAECLKLILKCYKFATYFDLPRSLRYRLEIVQWGEFLGFLINLDIGEYMVKYQHLDENSKNQLQISKVLKWSLGNINRLITRYVLGHGMSNKFKYEEFRKVFVNDFLPYLLQNLLKIIESWCTSQRWLSLSSLHLLIEILGNSINLKNLWLELKPIIPHLIQHFIYPIVIPGDEKILLFETDPQEYIQLTFNIFLENSYSPDCAAIDFVKKLTDKRKKSTIDHLMSFIYTELTKLALSDTLEDAKRKEAVLRILGGVTGHSLHNIKDKYYDQMEDFLITLVIPSLKSLHRFLVARGFEVLSKFCDLEFKNETNLNIVIYEILDNYRVNNNSDLVVGLENALCIQSYLHIEPFKESLSLIILPVMSKLLELSNQIDNDVMSVVMQECVENFSEQLQPFGVELIQKLVENFLKVFNEIEEDEQVQHDDDENGDKIITAIGVLNTIITVLLSFENSQNVIEELTNILSPLIMTVLESKDDNFLSEISEIIESLIYLNKTITPTLYEILILINRLFDDGIGVMYFEEMLPSLKNYLVYSDVTKLQNVDEFCQIFVNIFTKVDQNNFNPNDCNLNFELIQYFILILKPKAAKYFSILLNLVLPHFKNVESSSMMYRISFVNIVVSLLVYDSNLVILTLQEVNFNGFLNYWFSIIQKLTRCYDIKLSILGLVSLINNNNLMPSVNYSNHLIYLIKKLPGATSELNRKRKLFSSDFIHSIPENYDQDFAAESDTESDEDINNDDQNEYLNFLNEENLKLTRSTSTEEDIIEDPMELTPLDNINLNEILSNFISLLKYNNHNKYLTFFGHFQEDELTHYINSI